MNDEEMIVRLTDSIKKRPALYDSTNPEYKNYLLKAEIWACIAEELGIEDVYSIKNKWRNLRDAYSKYRKWCHTKDSKYLKYRNWPWNHLLTFIEVNERSNQKPSSDDETLGHFEEVDTASFLDYQTAPIKQETIKKRKLVEDIKTVDPSRMNIDNATNSMPVMDAVDLLFTSYAKTFKTLSKARQTCLKMEIAKLFYEAEVEDLNADSTSVGEE